MDVRLANVRQRDGEEGLTRARYWTGRCWTGLTKTGLLGRPHQGALLDRSLRVKSKRLNSSSLSKIRAMNTSPRTWQHRAANLNLRPSQKQFVSCELHTVFRHRSSSVQNKPQFEVGTVCKSAVSTWCDDVDKHWLACTATPGSYILQLYHPTSP